MNAPPQEPWHCCTHRSRAGLWFSNFSLIMQPFLSPIYGRFCRKRSLFKVISLASKVATQYFSSCSISIRIWKGEIPIMFVPGDFENSRIIVGAAAHQSRTTSFSNRPRWESLYLHKARISKVLADLPSLATFSVLAYRLSQSRIFVPQSHVAGSTVTQFSTIVVPLARASYCSDCMYH